MDETLILLSLDQSLKTLLKEITDSIRAGIINIWYSRNQDKIRQAKELLYRLNSSPTFEGILNDLGKYKEVKTLIDLLDPRTLDRMGSSKWFDEVYRCIRDIEQAIHIDLKQVTTRFNLLAIKTNYYVIYHEPKDRIASEYAAVIDNVYLLIKRYLHSGIRLPINAYLMSDATTLSAVHEAITGKKMALQTIRFLWKQAYSNLTGKKPQAPVSCDYRTNSIFVLIPPSSVWLGTILHETTHFFTDMRLWSRYENRMLGYENICIFFQMFGEDILNGRKLNRANIRWDTLVGIEWDEVGKCFYPEHREKHERLLNAALAVYYFIHENYGESAFLSFLDFIFLHPDCTIGQAIYSVDHNIPEFEKRFNLILEEELKIR